MNEKTQRHFLSKCVHFSELQVDGTGSSTVQILRTWSWNHPQYGTFRITETELSEFVSNFSANVRGVDLAVDVNHDPAHKAVGWVRKVYQMGNQLFADVEWNEEGLALIGSKAYRYFSPELFFSFRDEETGQEYRNVLVGWGITNRPFFKGMKALKASESETEGGTGGEFYFFSTETMTKKFSEIVAEAKASEKITKETLEAAKAAFSELPETEREGAKAELAELEAKVETETETPPATEVAETVTEPVAPTEEKKGEFSEKEDTRLFSETGLTIEAVKEMQSKYSKLAAEMKFSETEKKVSAFVFSESNKDGILLPKASGKFSEFANKLPDTLQAEFFELMGSKAFRTVEFKEIGVEGGESASVFSVPTATPEGFTRESFVLDTVTRQFSKKDNISYEAAMFKARAHIEANGIR